MSFFVSCPLTDAQADPHKSGHQPTSCMIVKSTLHVCPDLWGHADAPYLLRACSKKRHTLAPWLYVGLVVPYCLTDTPTY
ncbi:MAG TPA: hypothetical protein ENF36_08305 [Desulfobacteraceae bacterium]|nr:hypothetical protein [Desulfobacteraceae bacterium]